MQSKPGAGRGGVHVRRHWTLGLFAGKDMSDRGAQGTGYEERSQLVTRASLMLTVAVQEFAGLPAARCPCCFALSIVDSITADCRTWRMSRSCRDCLEPSWRGNGCVMD